MEIPKAVELEHQVFNIHNAKAITSVALEVFQYQYEHNPIYRQYCNAINRKPEQVKNISQIPFLPISFFKTHVIKSGEFNPEVIFSSSGTTGALTSRHYVKSLKVYETSFLDAFKRMYGQPEDYCILGLLPSYLERKGSSLVYMVDHLIKRSHHHLSGFYLNEFDHLSDTLTTLESEKKKTILIGVTYALLDFAKLHPQKLKLCTVLETGGMKGRSREITRLELYEQLEDLFGINNIHAEYGMTELLSQAYAINGRYSTPPWMKVMVRDETDPFTILSPETSPVSGCINIIDLANIYSCSFIATDDLGRVYTDDTFEVLGRLDSSDIRGCSLLVV